MKRWLIANRGFLLFLLCFGIFRSAMADWNPIPSGSMRPTLLEGDVVLVNRLAYDFKIPFSDISVAAIADPRRGDVATFASPRDGARLIKRIVGVPGDVVAMREDVLFVNGVAAHYDGRVDVVEPMAYGATAAGIRATERIAGGERMVQFLPEVAARRDFGPLVVPAESFFMLGDNRDNSADSRYIGFVPRRLLIGRAHHILVSADVEGHWRPRLERFAAPLQ